MARTKTWNTDSIADRLVNETDKVERESDGAKIDVTYPQVPTNDADVMRDILSTFAQDDANAKLLADMLNTKLKQGPVSAARRGVDESTAKAEEIVALMKREKDPKKKAALQAQLAALFAE